VEPIRRLVTWLSAIIILMHAGLTCCEPVLSGGPPPLSFGNLGFSFVLDDDDVCSVVRRFVPKWEPRVLEERKYEFITNPKSASNLVIEKPKELPNGWSRADSSDIAARPHSQLIELMLMVSEHHRLALRFDKQKEALDVAYQALPFDGFAEQSLRSVSEYSVGQPEGYIDYSQSMSKLIHRIRLMIEYYAAWVTDSDAGSLNRSIQLSGQLVEMIQSTPTEKHSVYLRNPGYGGLLYLLPVFHEYLVSERARASGDIATMRKALGTLDEVSKGSEVVVREYRACRSGGSKCNDSEPFVSLHVAIVLQHYYAQINSAILRGSNAKELEQLSHGLTSFLDAVSANSTRNSMVQAWYAAARLNGAAQLRGMKLGDSKYFISRIIQLDVSSSPLAVCAYSGFSKDLQKKMLVGVTVCHEFSERFYGASCEEGDVPRGEFSEGADVKAFIRNTKLVEHFGSDYFLTECLNVAQLKQGQAEY